MELASLLLHTVLGVEDQKLRTELGRKAARGRLTVRELERQASRRARGRGKPVAPPASEEPNRRAAIAELERHLGTRVWLHMPEGHSPGQLVLCWHDEEQLNGFWEKLMKD